MHFVVNVVLTDPEFGYLWHLSLRFVTSPEPPRASLCVQVCVKVTRRLRSALLKLSQTEDE